MYGSKSKTLNFEVFRAETRRKQTNLKRAMGAGTKRLPSLALAFILACLYPSCPLPILIAQLKESKTTFESCSHVVRPPLIVKAV